MTKHNQPQGYVLVIDEVTELIQAEHDAAWSEVARRLAHEIKNPLTPLQLSAERIAHKLVPILDEKSAIFVKRMTATISNQVKNMQGMVNAFSEYARAPDLNFRPSQLNDLLIEISELYRVNAKNAHLKVVTADIPLLKLDTNRFRQLLVNLVKNALEALPESSDLDERPCITLSTEQTKNEVILRVSDNGLGIPEELLPRLFEPYVTNKVKGTGLGLAIVKKVTEEHAGILRAENNADRGACFVIRLPIN
jgi:nitrogen fixation/metabolism regulation signal transduction histidine kinase